MPVISLRPDPASPIVLAGDDVGLFASDMHLGDHDPATAAAFFGALEAAVRPASHLFLLGDLFEAWVGDDQPDAVAADALGLFARITAEGRALYVMCGNRDFLLDRLPPGAAAPAGLAAPAGFAVRTGATMLGDPCAAMLFGEPVVLAHGDALCTDDREYQKVREVVRGNAWQTQFLARPLAERLSIAQQLRADSERAKAGRYIADVNGSAIDEVLRSAGASTMIHGHTHRPACHEWQLDGRTARRWVLPDWEAATGRGGFLKVDSTGFRRI